MRELGRRLVIGIGVAVVSVMAVGYAFIFGGVATPVRGDRATLDLPASRTAIATTLEDGRPVFLVNDPEVGIWVLDAQGRRRPGALPVAVAWCPATRTFADPADGSAYAADGRLRWGPAQEGLVAYATRPAPDDSTRVIVGSDTAVQGRAAQTDGPPDTSCQGSWLVHQPEPGALFDPSVAVDQEAPGWIWLDGSLERDGEGRLRLCDGAAADCETWADVSGIDPASVRGKAPAVEGLFIGRVRDDAIDGLIFVPDLVEAP